jgi:hypothetical protein
MERRRRQADSGRSGLWFLLYIKFCIVYCDSTLGGAKDTGTEDTISQFGRRNQMSSSNILSIHGLKKEQQFQDSNRDIQW